MAAPTSSSLPPGHNAPLAVLDPDDHGAWILICNAFGLTVVLITLLIRIYIRVKVSPPYGVDDWTVTGATAIATVQCGIVFSQVDTGYGKSIDLIDDGPLTKVQELAYAADILFLIAIYASKCCVVLFFQRLSPSRTSAIVGWSVLSACIAFAIASVLMVCFRCEFAEPWLQYNRTCDGLLARWKTVAALDIVSEIALFAMSIQLVWNLQTSFSKKSEVVFAFALRLLVILIAVIRLQYVERQIESDNPTLVGATATVLTQTELFYSVVAATIPCLRPFLAAFVTNYGAMGGDTILGGSYVISAHHKESKGSGASFAMRSLDSAKRAANRSEKRPVQQLPVTGAAGGNADTLRPDQVSNRISAGHGKGHHAAHDASSVGSDESTRGMIIKKEVAWQVDSQSWRTRSHHGVQPGQER